MDAIPKFEAREIIPRDPPKKIYARVLGGEFGRKIDEHIQKKYGEFEVIGKVGYNSESKSVEGSNVFYVTAVNEFLKDGSRTMTVDDAKQIINSDSLDLSGNYEDIALVARALEGRNEYFARKFVGEREFDLPVTVNLSNCVLNKDSESPHGLVVVPKDDAQIIPGDLGKYKGSAVLSGLGLSRVLGLDSGWDGLADSNSGGRVVAVKK